MTRPRTNIYLDEAQLDALRQRGLARRRSVADQVREAVDAYLGGGTPALAATSRRLQASDYPGTGADWARRLRDRLKDLRARPAADDADEKSDF